ncbi:putative fimbrial chaperone protein [Legionella massiliensis]|uniref:Putative fimbrial chaperone protein n=1 Tax=Legionella massiliensis TaxID=1034943 RepID=A0A078L165_9GAMM|nr:fimbria/pilus periplasmic chaperone [Legionella massiliensis]CDZ78962.1 putative fimbrial chaperone protein [Legionella massiliensis]CEE14700.1 putative fimbrial chaperone protein [Legionella massiliensis]
MIFVLINRKRLQKWFCGFFLFCVTCSGNAVGVSPTRLTLSPDTPIANLTLTNEGDNPLTLQLELVKWRQANDKEIYTHSDELIATPQIFRISAHGKQVVRIGLEYPLFDNQEKAYRLFIQEVIPKLRLKKKNQLTMALRISLPIIVKTLSPVQQNLVWSVKTLQAKTLKLRAENKGNNVVFINRLQFFSSDKQALTQPLTTFAYLLPGSTKDWTINTINAKKLSSIKASINDQISLVPIS